MWIESRDSIRDRIRDRICDRIRNNIRDSIGDSICDSIPIKVSKPWISSLQWSRAQKYLLFEYYIISLVSINLQFENVHLSYRWAN